MSVAMMYAVAGLALCSLGLYALIVYAHLLRKVLAINIMGSGVFLVLTALARRAPGGVPDVVPHAMVITGIVVAVAATALALALLCRLVAVSGHTDLSRPDSE